MDREGSFNRVAHEYDASRGGRERGLGFARQLAEGLATGELVFDIGAGTAVVTNELAALGFPVVALDISSQMLGLARERLGARVAVADAAALPIAGGVVPQAVSTWLLHIVPNPGAVFREVARVLRPGGRWLVLPSRAARDDDVLGRLVAEVDEAAGRGRDDSRTLAPLAEAAGLTFVREFAHREKEIWSSPGDLADRLAAGTYSVTWSPERDAAVRTVRSRVVRTLRDMPEPQKPVRRVVVDRVLEYRRTSVDPQWTEDS
jgi:ubiquinone/menaquinone biosynthesis C-methylase UbiE